MAPTLYSANLSDIAKPVKSRKQKNVDVPTLPAAPIEAEIPVETQKEQVVPEEPKKKERSEKQLAAFERAKESRRLKKEALDHAKSEEVRLQKEAQDVEEAALKAKDEKKLAMKEKRRLAREEKPKVMELQGEPLPKKQRTVKTQTPDDPPSWFKSYIMGVNTEKSKITEEKKPQRQLRYESNAQAETQWKEPLTRNRVTSEVDSHMNKMYSMIFNNRQV